MASQSLMGQEKLTLPIPPPSPAAPLDPAHGGSGAPCPRLLTTFPAQALGLFRPSLALCPHGPPSVSPSPAPTIHTQRKRKAPTSHHPTCAFPCQQRLFQSCLRSVISILSNLIPFPTHCNLLPPPPCPRNGSCWAHLVAKSTGRFLGHIPPPCPPTILAQLPCVPCPPWPSPPMAGPLGRPPHLFLRPCQPTRPLQPGSLSPKVLCFLAPWDVAGITCPAAPEVFPSACRPPCWVFCLHFLQVSKLLRYESSLEGQILCSHKNTHGRGPRGQDRPWVP